MVKGHYVCKRHTSIMQCYIIFKNVCMGIFINGKDRRIEKYAFEGMNSGHVRRVLPDGTT